jgi:hypothetical protein
VLLLSLVVLAGCGGEREAVSIPPGFTVRRVEEPRFSLALPAGWKSFGDGSGTNASSVAGNNDRLHAELELLTRSDSPIKLVAFDATSGSRSTTNMNVLQTQVPSSLTFEQMAKTEAAQIKLGAHVEDIRQQVTEVPAGRTLHLTYRPRSNAVVQQYFVRHHDLLYVLTYTARPGDAARSAHAVDRSAHTFEVG